VGEGLSRLANLFHPPFDYASVAPWDWAIFGMFICFPPVWLWRTGQRIWAGGTNNYDRAQQYISIIKLAMKEAKLSRTEQMFQWRAVFAKLANEFRVGAAPPSGDALAAQAQIAARDHDGELG
jgi:hypothetical protein